MKNALNIARSLNDFAVSNWGEHSKLAKETQFLEQVIENQHRAIKTLTNTLELLSNNRQIPVSSENWSCVEAVIKMGKSYEYPTSQ
jgi:hypothetical protein